jgi:molecular chaperone DnaK (HSP70)
MNKENSITVTGVDIGSAGIKIAAVVKGAVDVIVNEANMRETPNIVGFGEK